jgi:LmbE family N-acetylglucosaminyl deacetylase
MLGLSLDTNRPLRLLVIGAHADDIEIGCGATVLRLVRENPGIEVDWVVASAGGVRCAEAQSSAGAFLQGAATVRLHLWGLRDGFLPYSGEAVKERFEALKRESQPDLVMTHYRADLHQDHRLISDLTWNTFRDAVVLEYEIPKWDGDLGTPNVFVEADAAIAQRKIDLLHEHFASQRSRDWFDDQTFYSLLRIRGMECRSPSRLAEAFYARKLLFTAHTKRECCS